MCVLSDAKSPFLSPGLPILVAGTPFLTIGFGLVKFVVVDGALLLTIPPSANPVIPGAVDNVTGDPSLFATV